jgi:L-asparaginase
VTLWNRPTRAGLTEVPPTPTNAESPHRRDDERPAPHRTTPGRTAPSAPRVLVLPMTLGQDDAILRAVASQLDGLVIAGFGAGHTPEQLVPVLAELAARIPVILGTRAGAGPVAGRTYGYPGSETDLLARGLISAGYLDPYKARILLQVLLHRGATMEQIRAVVARLGAAPLG